MIFGASSGEMVDLWKPSLQYLALGKQILWGFVAAGAGIITYRIGWVKFYEKGYFIYGLLIVLLVAVFIPGLGVSANGSRRWISLFGLSLQPSELIKIFLPAFFLKMTEEKDKIATNKQFWMLMGYSFFPVLLIILEPNNGTAGTIALMLGLLILARKISWRFWLIPLLIASSIMLFAAWRSSYVHARIVSYLNPESDIKGKGHQPFQAKIAAGSGGLFGRGPAQSIQKLSYLPEAQNDYIAAIYAEEFGFVGILALLVTYIWLLSEILRIMLQQKTEEGFLWGLSFLYLFGFHFFFNLAVVSGLMPSTGLNLPFFSQGGSSLVANSMAIGLLLSLEKTAAPSTVKKV
jgi:cell division protein FtsW